MIVYKRVCKIHKVVRNKKLVPCETKIRTRKGITEEYCPKCREEGTNFGIKTAMFVEE